MDAKKKSCSDGNIKIKDSEADHDDHDDETGSEEPDLGLSLEKLNLGPKKKLLVMNLNGFLLHRIHVADKKAIPKSRTADYKYRYFLRNIFSTQNKNFMILFLFIVCFIKYLNE